MAESDHDIIELVRAGDRNAFSRLVDRHKDRAMALAVRMLKNRQDAEEALQDAFVRAYNALPRFEGRSAFGTWFYRIVFNVCSSALERRESVVHVSLDSDDEAGAGASEIPSEGLPPDLQLESSEAQKIVYEEVERLPESYASTFTLFVVQEMSYEEIVEVTGLPLGTIKARLFRARMLLRTAVARRLQLAIPAVTGKENAA